jgi:YegS/Rv2252/BmrU family lipid kinase
MDTPLPRTAALIVNARSRTGRAQFREACRLLEAAGITLSERHAVRKPKRIGAIVARAVGRGVPMVIVGGGDGTMSTAVDHLVGTDTVFAVLPLGTANSFARTLGLPLDLADAIGVIASGQTRAIDLGMIDDDHFANCATIGIAPQIAETVPHGLKSWLGRPGYLLWAARQLAAYEPFRVRIDGEPLEIVELRIANGRYHGGVDLVDEARLDSGRIVVQAVLGGNRRTLVWSWIASVLRLRARQAMTSAFTGEAIRIETDRPMPISIDGEVMAHTPVTARVARAAIKIAVPLPGHGVEHGGVGLHWRVRGPGSGQLRRLGIGLAVVAAGAVFAVRKRR